MATRHVIVDGSNLATEGRNMPSLVQLDQAVREFIAENPHDAVTVVVDASFGHRIDPSETEAFEAAEAAGEVVSPPAGAIGRGDAFLLRIAEKIGATVLSNDSFQEFHGEHPWLFEKGRLVGGKPVPGIGWIFMERSPVRGAKSREVVKEAKRRKRADGDAVEAAGKTKTRSKSVDRAIARATQEVVEPKAVDSKARRRRSGSPPSEPVNEPLAFITFIAAHPLGSEVVGSVLEYSSHGAFVEADGARCYIPLSAMGDPPPRRAREVITKGGPGSFVVQAFDPQRRGIELALPGYAKVAGEPTAETIEAEIAGDRTPKTARAAKVDGPEPADVSIADGSTPFTPTEVDQASARPASKRASKKAAPVAAPTAKKAAATKAVSKKAAAKKVTAKKTAAKKAVAKKLASGERATEEVTGTTVSSPVVPATTAGTKAAPAKRAASAKRAPSAKTAVAVEKTMPEKALAVEKAPAAQKTVAAESAPVKRTAAKKAVVGQTTTAKNATTAKKTAARKAPVAEPAPVLPGSEPAAAG